MQISTEKQLLLFYICKEGGLELYSFFAAWYCKYDMFVMDYFRIYSDLQTLVVVKHNLFVF